MVSSSRPPPIFYHGTYLSASPSSSTSISAAATAAASSSSSSTASRPQAQVPYRQSSKYSGVYDPISGPAVKRPVTCIQPFHLVAPPSQLPRPLAPRLPVPVSLASPPRPSIFFHSSAAAFPPSSNTPLHTRTLFELPFPRSTMSIQHQHPPPMAEAHTYPHANTGYSHPVQPQTTYMGNAMSYHSGDPLTGPPAAKHKGSASKSCWTRKRRPCGRLCPCCCCSCCCCCIVLILLAIAIGITTFFVWPRVPQVDLLEIKPITLPSGMDLASSMLNTITGSGPLSFTSEWQLKVAVDSPNYIGWHFDKVTGELVDPPTGRVVGTGNLTDFTLPARTNTTVTLPVQLVYKATSSNDANKESSGITGGILSKIMDPMLSRVITACQQKTKIPMTLKLSFLVPVIRWFGVPHIERSISLSCPFQMPSL
ncbi:hypothetical protein BDF19DRAFT_429274 [Syncephalis fuscata]|nr:hypothetical protein BDF19DRAFT_429274 [Syncephalis fuscata]